MDFTLKFRRNTHRHHCSKNRRCLGMSIKPRTEIIKERQRFEHWEIDTVVGKQGHGEVLLTLDEHMKHKRHIIRIAGKNKQAVKEGLQVVQRRSGKIFHKVFKTVTSDNGGEFSRLTAILKDIDIYFAHSHSSWKHRTNEKQDSMLRRFIPKVQDIGKVPDYTIQKAEDFINDLPLKMFNYRTPRELFNEQIALLSQT